MRRCGPRGMGTLIPPDAIIILRVHLVKVITNPKPWTEAKNALSKFFPHDYKEILEMPHRLTALMTFNSLSLCGKETVMIHPLVVKMMCFVTGPVPASLLWDNIR